MPLAIQSANRKDTSTAANGVMLQHRHFAFIAATIAAMDGSDSYRAEIAKDFATACTLANPQFDRARFLAACRKQD